MQPVDADIIEFRIQELEHERLRLAEEMDKLEDRRKEIQGAITELWKWLDTVKDAQGYGQTTFDGKARVLKLPELGSAQAIKDAIENRGTAIEGEDEELAAKVRMDRAQHDSAKLIRLMDGKGADAGSDTVQERPGGGEPGPAGPER
jgi:hypothetical protein